MSATLLVVMGQVLGIAFASGLNLYATIAAIGIASRLAWIPPLPPGLRGLESTIIIASALALFLVEFVADKLEPVEWLWDTLHTLIRPVAAALLVFGAMGGSGLEVQMVGAVAAAVVALAVHGSKAGLRVILRARSASWRCRAASALEDVGAVLLALAALSRPTTAVLATAALLLVILIAGRLLWRASLLGLRALLARLRGFFGRARWHGLRAVPGGVRNLLGPVHVGTAAPRVVRAAADGLPGVARYRNGWVVLRGDEAVFLFRVGVSPRAIVLPALRSGTIRRGRWADALELETGAGAFHLYLLKDGPAPEAVLGELLPTPAMTAA